MEQGKLSGLLPIFVFLLLFIGSGVLFADFYRTPAIVAFLLAFLVAFLQNNKQSMGEKLVLATRSMGQENVMLMCIIFLLAGAFSGAVSAAGGVESTVNFSLTILPPSVAVAGLFFISCFISLSMGTSVGTIAALTPIAMGISTKTGFPGAICLAAVVCGAMFGDNLSVISDTTIAATRTQGCRMQDKFKENFWIVLPAALLTAILFWLLASSYVYEAEAALDYSFLRILPYLVVLVGALLGGNVFLILFLGTILSVIVGVGTGAIPWDQVFRVIAGGPDGRGGVMSMYDITAISLVVAGVIGLVKENGGIQYILVHIRRLVHGPKGAQAGIAVLGSLVDIATANNTIAIIMSGSIVKDIAEEYGVSPKRAASLLDIFTSVWQGLLPYGAQLLYASAGAAAAGVVITPFELWPYLFYPVLMGVCAFGWILFKKA